MKYHHIEVDSEVLEFLKTHAEPFVDTPNTVLRKLLLEERVTSQSNAISDSEVLPDFPSSIPKALEQTLEMIYFVREKGYSRSAATNLVAEKHNVAVPTVIDKYCRQLGKRAFEIDEYLEEENLSNFEVLLRRRFSKHRVTIEEFFRQRRRKAEGVAHDMLESPLVGLWKDRDDIKDSVAYARELREKAQRRSD